MRADAAWADEIERLILAGTHPWQADAIVDPSRFVTELVGRGGGKTTALKARYAIGMARRPRSRFLYVAPTLGSAIELLWDPFKELVSNLGIDAEIKEAPREGGKICVFRRNGARLKISGAEDRKDLEKYRGQPFDGVGADECGGWNPELLDWFVERIITPRLGERRGWFVLAGTPGHVLKGIFYEATRPGSPTHRPYARRADPAFAAWNGWSSHDWSLADVVAAPGAAARWPAIVANWEAALEEKAKKQWSDSHPVWMREYLGKWATDESELVYKFRAHVDGAEWNVWDPPRDGPLRIARLPDGVTDWNFGFGMDLGSKDPFALAVFAISPSDPTRTLYHVWEVERPKAYAKIIAQVLLGEEHDAARPSGLIGALGWPNGIVVDVAQLGGNFVDELTNVYGVRCVPAERKPGAKHSAIALFNGDLIDGRVKILKGSALAAQLGELRWKEDEFRIVKEDKAQANHLADAAIYARQVLASMLGGSVDESRPPPPRPEPPIDEPRPPAPRDELGSRRAPGAYYDPFA